MAAPQITVVFDPPLPTDTGVEFDAKAFETVSDWNDWSLEANALAVFQNEKADETLMAAIAGNLSEVDLSVAAGDLIGVNVGGTALESVEIEEVPKATQAEAETGTNDDVYMTPLKASMNVDERMNRVGDAPMFAARAWVKFSVSGGVVTVEGEGNIASVTRISSGIFEIDFTTPMPSDDYAFTGTYSAGANQIVVVQHFDGDRYEASGIRIAFNWEVGASGGLQDPVNASIVFFA